MPSRPPTPRSPQVFVRPAATQVVPRAVAAGLDAAGGPTVGWMVDEFLTSVADGSARDRHGRRFTREAARAMRWNLRAHLDRTRGGWRLRALDRADIETLLFELHAAGLAPERVRVLARSVRALYDHALERGLVDHNPAERLAIPDDADTPAATRGSRRARPLRNVMRVATLAGLVTVIVLLGATL
jgi:hypothetical protein